MSAERPFARSTEEIRECVEFETVRSSVAAAALLAAIRDEDVQGLALVAETVDPDTLDAMLGSLGSCRPQDGCSPPPGASAKFLLHHTDDCQPSPEPVRGRQELDKNR